MMRLIKAILLLLWLGSFGWAMWQETQDHHARFDLWLEPASDLHKGSIIIGGLPYTACRKWNRFDLAGTLFQLRPLIVPTSKLQPGECKEIGARFIPLHREEKVMQIRECGADLILGLTFTLLIFHLGYTIKERAKCRNL